MLIEVGVMGAVYMGVRAYENYNKGKKNNKNKRKQISTFKEIATNNLRNFDEKTGFLSNLGFSQVLFSKPSKPLVKCSKSIKKYPILWNNYKNRENPCVLLAMALMIRLR